MVSLQASLLLEGCVDKKLEYQSRRTRTTVDMLRLSNERCRYSTQPCRNGPIISPSLPDCLRYRSPYMIIFLLWRLSSWPFVGSPYQAYSNRRDTSQVSSSEASRTMSQPIIAVRSTPKDHRGLYLHFQCPGRKSDATFAARRLDVIATDLEHHIRLTVLPEISHSTCQVFHQPYLTPHCRLNLLYYHCLKLTSSH